MSETIFKRDLKKLIKAKIIAYTKTRKLLYIYPSFIFNGNIVKSITDNKT